MADSNFVTEFCSSDPSFKSNILKSFYAKSELLRMRKQLLVYTYYMQVSRHGVSSKLTLRILSINGINRQHHECDHVAFHRNTFRRAVPY